MIGNRSFLSKLKAQPTVGVVLQSASPLVANSMSAAGFDWLVIDPINSPLSQLESFAMQTAVGDGNPTPVFMRVGGPTDRSGIQQATDTGAAGILVPNVRSADDIAKARRPTRFPPVGDRSLYGPLRAHHKEGVVVHMLRADRSFVVAIQLEKAPIESWDHLLAARLPRRRSRYTAALRGDRTLRCAAGRAARRRRHATFPAGAVATRLPAAVRRAGRTHYTLYRALHQARQGGRRPAGRSLGGSAVPEPRHEIHRDRIQT